MISKKDQKIAKALYKASTKNGLFDTQKASLVISALVKLKPVNLKNILRAFQKLASQALSSQTVIVESGEILSSRNLAKELQQKTGAQKVIFKKNPQIVFGAKITHGDWIYEDTLGSRLNQIIK